MIILKTRKMDAAKKTEYIRLPQNRRVNKYIATQKIVFGGHAAHIDDRSFFEIHFLTLNMYERKESGPEYVRKK